VNKDCPEGCERPTPVDIEMRAIFWFDTRGRGGEGESCRRQLRKREEEEEEQKNNIKLTVIFCISGDNKLHLYCKTIAPLRRGYQVVTLPGSKVAIVWVSPRVCW